MWRDRCGPGICVGSAKVTYADGLVDLDEAHAPLDAQFRERAVFAYSLAAFRGMPVPVPFIRSTSWTRV
jgi:hypothetical protein